MKKICITSDIKKKFSSEDELNEILKLGKELGLFESYFKNIDKTSDAWKEGIAERNRRRKLHNTSSNNDDNNNNSNNTSDPNNSNSSDSKQTGENIKRFGDNTIREPDPEQAQQSA